MTSPDPYRVALEKINVSNPWLYRSNETRASVKEMEQLFRELCASIFGELPVGETFDRSSAFQLN